MPEWRFEITSGAENDLSKLDAQIQNRVVEKLKWFQENFSKITPLPLGGKWRGFFKFRVGDWRVIYEVETGVCEVVIHAIDNRDKIYKQRHAKNIVKKNPNQ